jgi:polysaccharide export outer membrane protein
VGLGLLAGLVVIAGCMCMDEHPTLSDDHRPTIDPDTPRELQMMSLPPYVVEPPDILLIDSIRVIPKPPYKIEPLDSLLIDAPGALPTDPVRGIYGVEPDGTVNLGASYGSARVAGLTLKEAKDVIEKQLAIKIIKPTAMVALGAAHGMQQIRGEHLIRPDGTVGLGTYGSVYIAGMTLDQARSAIEAALSTTLLDPKISIDVFSYNSKYFYIVADGAGYGQQVIRFPVTGKETVLDAVSQIYGLPGVSSKKHIWVARPNTPEYGGHQVLPVDWMSIVAKGDNQTNYQLLPGDRLYIQSDGLIHANNILTKVFAPLEKVMGVTHLGTSTVSSIESLNLLFRTGNSGNGGTATIITAPAAGGR